MESDVGLETDAPDVEITPAMIEAGVSVLCAFDTTFEGEVVWAERIYLAMERAKRRRSGVKHLYTMQDGENCAVLPNGRMVITHPDRAPKVINLDGSEELLDIAHGL